MNATDTMRHNVEAIKLEMIKLDHWVMAYDEPGGIGNLDWEDVGEAQHLLNDLRTINAWLFPEEED